jgi:hypothetical protein
MISYKCSEINVIEYFTVLKIFIILLLLHHRCNSRATHNLLVYMWSRMVWFRKLSSCVIKKHLVKLYNISWSRKVSIECAGLVLSIRDTRGLQFGPKRDIMTYIFRDFPQFLQRNPGLHIKLIHNFFLSYNFQNTGLLKCSSFDTINLSCWFFR